MLENNHESVKSCCFNSVDVRARPTFRESLIKLHVNGSSLGTSMQFGAQSDALIDMKFSQTVVTEKQRVRQGEFIAGIRAFDN